VDRRVQIIGSYLSPYVRKVLVALGLKGLRYEIDPIVPFLGDTRFAHISPLRRIPVLLDDRVTLADSSVICQYLEERYPQPALYPADIVDRARARWLEEFADTRMGEVFIWQLYNELAIKPHVWGEATDPTVVERARTQEIPSILDYLEEQIPAVGYLFGALGIADLSIATFLRNAAFVGYRIDAARWPRTARLVGETLDSPPFRELVPFEERLLRAPIGEHRRVLAEMGAPLSDETYAGTTPKRGILRI
jgi:glutathione S-transferase